MSAVDNRQLLLAAAVVVALLAPPELEPESGFPPELFAPESLESEDFAAAPSDPLVDPDPEPEPDEPFFVSRLSVR